jgi:hypothetical protein
MLRRLSGSFSRIQGGPLGELENAETALVDSEARVFGSELEVFGNSQPKELAPGLKGIFTAGKKQVTVSRGLLTVYAPFLVELSRLETLQSSIAEHSAALKTAEAGRADAQISEWRSKLESLQDQYLTGLSRAIQTSVEPRIAACENLTKLTAEIDAAVGNLQVPVDPTHISRWLRSSFSRKLSHKQRHL